MHPYNLYANYTKCKFCIIEGGVKAERKGYYSNIGKRLP